MADKTFYDLFGLSTECSPEEIFPAYQKRLAVFENINQGDAAKLKLGRTVLGNAYLTLSDPTRRADYDKKNKIRKRYKPGKTKATGGARRNPSSGNFLGRILGSIFSDIWSIFRPILKLGVLVACIWGVFFSEYTAQYRAVALEKGRLFVASFLPEPVDPYETLRCQKIRTEMADLKQQEEKLVKKARAGAIVGLGATTLSLLAGKENTARFFAKDTMASSVPASKQLKVLRQAIRDSSINNLECFERGSGKGQQLGPVTVQQKQPSSTHTQERVIEKTIIREQRPKTIIIQPEPKWEQQPSFGSSEWNKRYPTPYSR